jgi:hypothetical protein
MAILSGSKRLWHRNVNSRKVEIKLEYQGKGAVMHFSTEERMRQRSVAHVLSCLLLSAVLSLCSCASKPLPCSFKASAYPGMPQRLHDDVAYLSQLDPPRRAADLESLNRAADYIAQEFNKAGCPEVRIQHFPVEKGTDYRNIICSFGPDEGEHIIVGAHYDVSPEKGRRPGADDNASGIAGILELARMLSSDKPALRRLEEIKRPVDLIAYTLEEPPYFGSENMGSYQHASLMAEKKVPVLLMMSLEMIGYFSGEYAQYIAVVGKNEQRDMISRVSGLMARQGGIDVVSAPLPSFIYGIDWSDHRNYWHFNYQAVMVTDTSYLRNPNYHEVTDTVDKLDFTRMAGVVKGVYDAMLCY